MFGTQLHGALEMRPRAVQLLRPPERHPEVITRIEVRRLQRDRALELGDRIRRASLLSEHEAEPIVSLGERRRRRQRAPVLFGREIELLISFVLFAKLEMCPDIGVRRLAGC